MDELIQKVAAKTGLPPEQAKKAADAVIAYMKEKLPAGLAGQLEGLLASGGGGLGNITETLGGLFGKK